MPPPPAEEQGDQAETQRVAIDAASAQLPIDAPGEADQDQPDMLEQEDGAGGRLDAANLTDHAWKNASAQNHRQAVSSSPEGTPSGEIAASSMSPRGRSLALQLSTARWNPSGGNMARSPK